MSRIAALQAWLHSNRIWYDNERIAIEENASDGMYIRALTAIKPGITLVRIPKSAILSTKSTAIANLLTGEMERSVLGLIVAMWYESGVDSPWKGYIDSLPEKVDVPLLWDEGASALLHKTEVWPLLEDTRDKLKRQYLDIVQPLYKDNKELGDIPPWRRFLELYTLVESRSFNVDVYHGLAMVPLADVFNHSDMENVHFQTDDMVCEYCGSLEECFHIEEDIDEQQKLQALEGEVDIGSSPSSPSSLPDLIDPTRAPSYSPNPHDMPSPPPNQTNILDKEDTCDLVCSRFIPALEQCYNTYGDLPNHVLLSRYGFIIEGNPHDVVFVDKQVRQMWGGKSLIPSILERVREGVRFGLLGRRSNSRDDRRLHCDIETDDASEENHIDKEYPEDEVDEYDRESSDEGLLHQDEVEEEILTDDISTTSSSTSDILNLDDDAFVSSLLPIMTINADGEVSDGLYRLLLLTETDTPVETIPEIERADQTTQARGTISSDVSKIMSNVYASIYKIIKDRCHDITGSNATENSLMNNYIAGEKRILEVAADICRHRQKQCMFKRARKN